MEYHVFKKVTFVQNVPYCPRVFSIEYRAVPLNIHNYVQCTYVIYKHVMHVYHVVCTT